jgi:hypothetical protein
MERFLGDRTADEYRLHMNVIKEITESWHNGGISTATKRAQIAAENARFYDGGQLGATGSALTSEPRMVDEAAFLLSDSSGVPLEAAQAALHTRRRASIRAANSDSIEEARELMEEGRRGYAEILATAR